MAAAESDVRQESDEAVEAQARQRGWRPKDQWRGNPDRWVDAKTYLAKSEELIPHLRNSNRELSSQVEALNNKISEQERLLRANNAAIEELTKVQTETIASDVESRVKGLRRQISEARREGNEELALDLEDQYDEARDALREARKAKAATRTATTQTTTTTTTQLDPTKDPDFQVFLEENDWWKNDPVMRAASIEIGNGLVRSGEAASLSKKDFFGRVAFETLRRFGQGTRERPSQKVEPGGGARAASVTTGKRFEDLPTDAQAACDRLSSRFVGKKSADGSVRYKDAAAWRQSYADKYFGGA